MEDLLDLLTQREMKLWETRRRLKDRIERAQKGEEDAVFSSDPRVAQFLRRIWMDAKTRKGAA